MAKFSDLNSRLCGCYTHLRQRLLRLLPQAIGPDEDNAVKMPREVLVLEDSLIIAMEAEDIFRSLGADMVHIASNLQQAQGYVDKNRIDFALLDVNLGPTMSFDFARALRERGIPFGFSSGYPDNAEFPEDLREIALLRKPFGDDMIRDHLKQVLGG